MLRMKRAVRSVIRFIATGFIVVGGMYAGLEFAEYRTPGANPSVLRILVSTLAVVAGLVLFAASSGLAARFTDDYDE